MANRFLPSVPVLETFSGIVDPEHYVPLPDDWLVGLSDVVHSTEAIEAGRYKTVNVAGAAVIAAMGNALGGQPFPFVFGGDGASFAVPAELRDVAAGSLTATAALVRDELGLQLRTALVPVAAIREAGLDIRLAFFAASADVTYAMFSGGGLTWAEERMKAGEFALQPGPKGTRPDLTGLSCRFEPMESRRGLILSLIVRPYPEADPARYRGLIDDILALVDASPDMACPVPEAGPALAWPPAGLALEARLGLSSASLRGNVALLTRTALAHLVFRLGWRVGRFDPKAYLLQLVGNSDYRKYDDGLRMTIDCSAELADEIEARLTAAANVALYGLHRQGAAMMTCFTPSVHRRDHVHFVDGASGGYAAAAMQLKTRDRPVAI
jgi:hypothetical protein